MICAGFLCLFLHSIYSGSLVTTMIERHTPSMPFKSTSELAKLIASGKYKLIAHGVGNSFMQKIQVKTCFAQTEIFVISIAVELEQTTPSFCLKEARLYFIFTLNLLYLTIYGSPMLIRMPPVGAISENKF